MLVNGLVMLNRHRNRCAAQAAFFVLGFISSSMPGLAYYFQGYYCPQQLVSPMRDDIAYTPVGMGIVTSKAGFRVHPVTGKADFHNGVDLGAHLNDRVYCLLDGIVTRVGWRGAMGVAVEIYHPYPNIKTICGHLNAYSVLPGMIVQRGRVIGYAGSTGRSTGVHVHYTVIKCDTNEYIQPMQFIPLVPKYVAQLKTAQAQIAMRHNLEEVQKQGIDSKPVDTDTEDLPDDKSTTKKAAAAKIITYGKQKKS
jgi:murein DD-endopeptidase MepM/ murein hydrolase activator NlpD